MEANSFISNQKEEEGPAEDNWDWYKAFLLQFFEVKGTAHLNFFTLHEMKQNPSEEDWDFFRAWYFYFCSSNPPDLRVQVMKSFFSFRAGSWTLMAIRLIFSWFNSLERHWVAFSRTTTTSLATRSASSGAQFIIRRCTIPFQSVSTKNGPPVTSVVVQAYVGHKLGSLHGNHSSFHHYLNGYSSNGHSH